jgi:hypothetical protein
MWAMSLLQFTATIPFYICNAIHDCFPVLGDAGLFICPKRPATYASSVLSASLT